MARPETEQERNPIRPYFEGEIVSDVCDLSFKRIPGARIKHRVKQNWLKMDDKAGSVLRLEMVINEPEGFTVRKQVTRKGKKVMRWVDMRKGVAYLFRYQEVSLAANSRYLAALSEVDNPTDAIRTLDRITTRKQLAPKRSAKAFNPLARDEVQIFRALLDGKGQTQGFSAPERHCRSPPAKCQGNAHLQSMSRSRIDRQDSPLSTLALNQTRPHRDVCIHSTARYSIPHHI